LILLGLVVKYLKLTLISLYYLLVNAMNVPYI